MSRRRVPNKPDPGWADEAERQWRWIDEQLRESTWVFKIKHLKLSLEFIPENIKVSLCVLNQCWTLFNQILDLLLESKIS